MPEFIEGLKLTQAEWEAIVLALKYTPYGRFEEIPQTLKRLQDRVDELGDSAWLTVEFSES